VLASLELEIGTSPELGIWNFLVLGIWNSEFGDFPVLSP
jgi:hypothetical protein